MESLISTISKLQDVFATVDHAGEIKLPEIVVVGTQVSFPCFLKPAKVIDSFFSPLVKVRLLKESLDVISYHVDRESSLDVRFCFISTIHLRNQVSMTAITPFSNMTSTAFSLISKKFAMKFKMKLIVSLEQIRLVSLNTVNCCSHSNIPTYSPPLIIL